LVVLPLNAPETLADFILAHLDDIRLRIVS
jgi:hypothetical protein